MQIVAFFGWPIVVAALVTTIVNVRPGTALLIGTAIGFLPAALLVLYNELFASSPSPTSDVSSKKAVSFLYLFFWGIPNATAGAIGGFIGTLVSGRETIATQ